MDGTTRSSEGFPAEEAFFLAGHGVRLAILRTLATAGERLPFSAIDRAVDVRDGGRLNYHLDQLTPALVDHDADGYRLEQPGYNLVRLVDAGAVREGDRREPEPVDADCVRCGGALALDYDGQFARVACWDCQHWYVRYVFPPGAAEGRSTDELLAALDRRCRSVRADALAGVCPLCSGRLRTRLVPGDPDRYDHPVAVEYDCADCTCLLHSTAGAHVVEHPAVVALLRTAGDGWPDRPLWELPFAFDPAAVEVGPEPTAGARVRVAATDERLDVELDAAASVVAP